MLKTMLIVLAFVFVPTAALADASAAGLTAPATSGTDAQSGVGGAPAVGPAGNQSPGGSNADASSLQPAGTSSVQSTSSANSDGLTAGASALQAPASSDAVLKVISGDLDGAPQTPSDTGSNLVILWFALLFGIIVAAGYYFLRRHEQRSGY